MKLLFVENRFATHIYASVAEALCKEGHDIHWLVQNPLFAPNTGKIHLLPFPVRRAPTSSTEDRHAWIRNTDRGVLHFGQPGTHYSHYERLIEVVLAELRPDVVFGEPTQFHELLTLDACRRAGIPYLAPVATRYPSGRVAFMTYDTMDPVGGCGIPLSEGEAREMVRSVAARRLVPSYMAPRTHQVTLHLRLRRKAQSMKVVGGWLLGERFITPSPWRKFSLERSQGKAVKRWEALACNELPAEIGGRPWVLFPLQMQPEGNLDVWGQPWNDQTDLVRRAAASLQKVGGTLVVKPNPKSKYEITRELCEVVASTPNVIALSHTVPMQSVFSDAPLVLTVTGTVLLECLFAGKAVASLGSHAMTRYPGVTALPNPDALGSLFSVEPLRRATEVEAIQLLQHLHESSYPGELFDPFHDPDKLDGKDISLLAAAFLDAASFCTGRGGDGRSPTRK